MLYMFKKLLFSILAVICIYNVAVIGYRIFEPRDDTQENSENYLDYETLSQYILSTGENTVHYVFFCSLYNSDCVYIENSVLSAIEKDTDITVSSTIEIVDVTELDEEDELNRLEEEWNISAVPAFAAITSENGTAVVLNTLIQTDKTLTADEITAWITENEISGSIQEN